MIGCPFCVLILFCGTMFCFLVLNGCKNRDVNNDKEQEEFLIEYREKRKGEVKK